MATPILTGAAYDFLITTFMFIFIFAILYAIISKIELFGENKAVQAAIAFAAAMLVIFIPETRALINFMTPWFVIFIIVIIFMLLIVMALGIKHTEITDYLKDSPGTTTTIVVVVLLIFLFAMYKVFGPIFTMAGPGETGLWATITRTLLQPKILGVLFLLLIASSIVKHIGFKD